MIEPMNINLEMFPELPADQAGPVFAEPWQAQAFGLAVALHAAGRFEWRDFSAALSKEIYAAQDRGEPDLGDTYYNHWLVALEVICCSTEMVSQDMMQQRKEEWKQAYLHTPHGKAVELA
ncbi:MAG: nitrile hydratase accessory protein [Parasphingorhabdus sp.]